MRRQLLRDAASATPLTAETALLAARRLLGDVAASLRWMPDGLRDELENWRRAVTDVNVDSQGDVLLNAMVTRPLILVRSSLMPVVAQLVSREFQVDTTFEAIGR